MSTIRRISTLALLAAITCSLLPAATASAASGKMIRDWNEIARAQPSGNPLRLARVLAIMHAAQHDAVNGVRARYERHSSTLSDGNADPRAAAAAAAHEVLVAFFPANRAVLDEALTQSLSAVPDGPAEDAGVALGRAVGWSTLERRSNDGFDESDPFTPAPGPGVWQSTPPAFAPMLEPQFQNVAPFAVQSREQFLPEAPPALSSAEYALAFNEVKLIGQDSSPVRSSDQTHIAHFWAEPSPSGWSRVANIASDALGYDLHETAQLLALVNLAMADGFIIGWYEKRHFAFWRPVTAIRQADADGNPETQTDPSWMSLRPTPPLPDYPSTHSLLGSAAAEVLRRIVGGDGFAFCMSSATAAPAGTERCWQTFTQAELENAESRVLVGFHFRFAIDTGVTVGRKVGKYTVRHTLQPK